MNVIKVIEDQVTIIISETGPQGIQGPAGSSTVGTIKTITDDYALSADDDVILVDASAGDVVISWLPANIILGKRVSVKKIDSSANSVTLQPFDDETIDGISPAVIYVENICLTIISDGSLLRII